MRRQEIQQSTWPATWPQTEDNKWYPYNSDPWLVHWTRDRMIVSFHIFHHHLHLHHQLHPVGSVPLLTSFCYRSSPWCCPYVRMSVRMSLRMSVRVLALTTHPGCIGGVMRCVFNEFWKRLNVNEIHKNCPFLWKYSYIYQRTETFVLDHDVKFSMLFDVDGINMTSKLIIAPIWRRQRSNQTKT